jgi:hypothetical protein
MEQQDDARACAMMTSELQRGITSNLRSDALPGSCRTRRACLLSGQGSRQRRRDGDEDQSVGGRATATVTAKPTSDVATGPVVESDVRLEKRDGRWLIANF